MMRVHINKSKAKHILTAKQPVLVRWHGSPDSAAATPLFPIDLNPKHQMKHLKPRKCRSVLEEGTGSSVKENRKDSDC